MNCCPNQRRETMKQVLLWIATMILATWVVAPAVSAQSRFDGTWKVDRETTSGRCAKYNTFLITIRDRVITGVSSAPLGLYEQTGRVFEDGSFLGEFKGSRGQGTSHGTLSDDKGEGQWAATGGWCSGVISLRREQ